MGQEASKLFAPVPSKGSAASRGDNRSAAARRRADVRANLPVFTRDGGTYPDIPIKVHDAKSEPLHDIPTSGKKIKYEKRVRALHAQEKRSGRRASAGEYPPHGYGDADEGVAQKVCWKMSVPFERFRDGLIGGDAKVLRSRSVRILFPVFDKYFVAKTFRSSTGFTLHKLLSLVQRQAAIASAFYIKDKRKMATGPQKDGRDEVALTDILPVLDKHTSCALVLVPGRPGYDVYVA